MQAIGRVLAILRSVAAGHRHVGDIASATGLPKSTVSRLLGALVEAEMLERHQGDRGHVIGPGLAALAVDASQAGTLRDVCRPYLRDLVDRTGEAAELTLPDGPTMAMYADHAESSSDVLTRDWTGMRFPYHTIAGGYALMTTWSDDQVRAYVRSGLESYSDRTLMTLDGIIGRLVDARRSGYVWTLGDFSTEINGVAAPIIDRAGTAVAALSVYGPAFRFPFDDDLVTAGELVNAVATTVGRRLRGG